MLSEALNAPRSLCSVKPSTLWALPELGPYAAVPHMGPYSRIKATYEPTPRAAIGPELRTRHRKNPNLPTPSSSPLLEEERERLRNPKNPKSPSSSPSSSPLLEEEKEREGKGRSSRAPGAYHHQFFRGNLELETEVYMSSGRLAGGH